MQRRMRLRALAEIPMQLIEPLMPWQFGPDYPRWTEALGDQTQVLIRPVCKEDAAAERTFIDELSPAARRFRFLGQIRHPSNEMVRQLTDLDYSHDLAFAAVVRQDEQDRFVAVGRYSTSADGTECEVAITVLDDWQGTNLGSILMGHLIEVARSRGIKRMWSMDSAANIAMTELARETGFHSSQDPDDASQVIHSLWL